MYKFSQHSLDNLESCHPDLQDLADAVLALQLFDFGVSCGKRTEEELKEALRLAGEAQTTIWKGV